MHTARGLGAGCDLACLGERNFGEYGADKLIYERCEERDSHNLGCDTELGKPRVGSDHLRHTDSNACLGQKRYAEVSAHIGLGFGDSGTDVCSAVLADGTGKDVYDAGKPDRCKDGEIQLRAREHEEQHEKSGRPVLGEIENFDGVLAQVCEECAEHHTGQQGGKLPKLTERNARKDCGNHEA